VFGFFRFFEIVGGFWDFEVLVVLVVFKVLAFCGGSEQSMGFCGQARYQKQETEVLTNFKVSEGFEGFQVL
jgi:hypothetical protein